MGLALAWLATAGCGPETPGPECAFAGEADAIEVPPPYTPRWAFEPWISKDISDSADTRAFVQGFLDRDIPVGVVVIDSPWETNYNTFVPHPDLYPDLAQLVADVHGKGVRIVLWTTQFVNETSEDRERSSPLTYEGPADGYALARSCRFFVNDGKLYRWWKGEGASLDFMNPDAVAWWRRLQDPILDLGIDGWKLDGGDDFVRNRHGERAAVKTAAGKVSLQEYSEAFYREMYAYGVHRRGREFTTMTRAFDARTPSDPGRYYARPEHAPVTWAGDNTRDWDGFADALDHVFRSAAAGYAVVGSDLGGFLETRRAATGRVDLPFDTLVFARWTAVGALQPFMQLHGQANIEPWTVPDHVDATVELYRYWATLHRELVPFFYSLARETHAGGEAVVRPVGGEANWPGDYRFEVGDAFLVAPILDATGVRDVSLPEGRWYDWWEPRGGVLEGDRTLRGYDLGDRLRSPLFVREGAIVPAEVSTGVTGLGSAASAGHLTVLVYPGPDPSTFRLHDVDDAVTTFTARRGSVTLSRVLRPTLLRIRSDAAPTKVESDGAGLPLRASPAELDGAASGWRRDAELGATWVKLPAGADPVTVRWR